MTMSGTSQLEPRVDSGYPTSSIPSPNELEQDSTYWKEDGDIVLICESLAFRVNSAVLSRDSDVFRDLVQSAKRPAQDSSFGCPLLRIEDPGHAIRILLDYLYGEHLFPDEGPAEFSLVATSLELAHKYRLRDLFSIALARLKTVFTDNFDVWDELARVNALSSPALTLDVVDAVRVISAGRSFGLATTLPFAFYLCCLADTRLLTRGYVDSSGIEQKLSLEDLERCIDGKPKLAHQCRSGMAHMYTGASTHCINKPRCSSTLLQLLAYPGEVRFGALARAGELVDQVSKHYGLCNDCNSHMKGKHLEWRKKVWNELPGYFGLGTWESLRAVEPSI